VVRHRLVKAIIKAYERDKQDQEEQQDRRISIRPPGKEG
jgi:phosphate starvation-inducible protein PhoH